MKMVPGKWTRRNEYSGSEAAYLAHGREPASGKHTPQTQKTLNALNRAMAEGTLEGARPLINETGDRIGYMISREGLKKFFNGYIGGLPEFLKEDERV